MNLSEKMQFDKIRKKWEMGYTLNDNEVSELISIILNQQTKIELMEKHIKLGK